MSRICPLFSGSTGNSTYIGTKNGDILIDAGASMKGMSAAVSSAGGDINDILAVAITHEHIDHIKGLKTLLNKTNAKLIASKDTLEALIKLDKVPVKTEIICLDEEFEEICGIQIGRFATSHDCKGSSGYVLNLPDNKKVSICTDLGVVSSEVRNAICGSDLVLLESNHDVEMLKRGPYPANLKVRILSDQGHISNNVCANELPFLLNNGTKRFILGHLSRHNNTPMLAKSCAQARLMDLSAENGKDYILTVAKPDSNGVTVI